MDLKDAIVTVLAAEGGPLQSATITERVLDEGLWETTGKTPAATVAASLYSDIKKHGADSRFVQTGKNLFFLNPRLSWGGRRRRHQRLRPAGHPLNHLQLPQRRHRPGLRLP